MSDVNNDHLSTTPSATRPASSIVVGSARSSGRKKRLLIIGLIGFVILGLIAGGYLWYQHKHPKAPAAVVINLRPPTDEQRHTVNAVIRADGTIVSFTDSSVTVMMTDQAKPVVLQTDKTTHYMQGNRGFPSDHTALKAGHRTVLTYDKDSIKAISIWVDYDAK